MHDMNTAVEPFPVNIQSISDEAIARLAGRIRLPRTAPDRSTINANTWDKLFVFGEPTSAMFLQVKKRSFWLSRMERHIATQEVVIALNGPVVVPMAPAGQLAESQGKMIAFYLPQGEGLIIHSGVWHLAPFPLEETAGVLVLFKTDTPQKDMEFQELKPPVQMVWA